MRVLLLTNCKKMCNYLVMKKLRYCASHPKKGEYSLGNKAPTSTSHSLHIFCSQQ